MSLTLIANFIARKEKITNFAAIDEVHFTKSQNTRSELYTPFLRRFTTKRQYELTQPISSKPISFNNKMY